MHMAGRAKYGVIPPCKNRTFSAIEKYTGRFRRKNQFPTYMCGLESRTKIPESPRGTVFSEGGDANVG